MSEHTGWGLSFWPGYFVSLPGLCFPGHLSNGTEGGTHPEDTRVPLKADCFVWGPGLLPALQEEHLE